MRTVIYARFSSDNQNPRSTADQIALCRERADREGWTVAATFEDAAISGAAGIGDDQRPGLSAMLAMVEAGGIDQVLAESTDRISRHVADAHIIRERIEFAGARLFTLFDGTVTPMIGLVKGFMDAQFRTDLAHRVKRGQRGTIAQGRSAGGLSYGYRVANRLDERGRLVAGLREIDEDRAGIVRRIFREYAAGISARSIAGGLNRDDIPSPRGGYWHASTILGEGETGFGILRNRLYIGELVYGRTKVVINPRTRRPTFRPNHDQEPIVQAVPALRIIDDDIWHAVQRQIVERGFARPERARRPKHLLSGLCKCGHCGNNYVLFAGGSWRCGKLNNGGHCTNRRTINTGPLEREVLAQLKREMLAPDAVREYLREYHRDYAQQVADIGKSRARLERKLAEANRKMERMVEAFASGGSEFVEIRDMLTAARADRDHIAQELASLQAIPVLTLHPGLADDYRREVERLETALRGNEAQRLETIPKIRAMIDRVELHPNPERRGTIVNVVRRLDQVLAIAMGQVATA